MSPTKLHIGASSASETNVEKRQNLSESTLKNGNLIEKINYYLASFQSIKTDDKVNFFRLMATMINAGISITKALKILSEQTENTHFKQIIDDLTFQIEGGLSFSESLGKYPQYFSNSQIGMVESGEATGRLNQTLLQIASETEKSANLSKKIKGAMIYPIAILTIMSVVIYVIMAFVMPKIKEVFEGLGGKLPPLTQLLIKMSNFIVAKTGPLPNSIWLIIFIIVFLFIFFKWKKTKSGRIIWTLIIMRLPVFGKLIKKSAIARFCRSISTLTNSGVSIVKSLYITAASVSNPIYEERIKLIASDVKKGITMGENLKDDPLFPSMVVGMINVAEQTAQVDQITEKLAEYYESEVDDMVKNLSKLMEPIIMVVLGLTVGFLVVAVMQPMLESSDLATINE